MKTVLVVDDEWIIATVIEEILVEAGYRVLTAPNGQVALERLAVEMPDAILVDYMMPIMNGAALLAHLAADERHSRIPVILMTSLPEPVVARDCNDYTTYLSKPFLDSELLAAIDKCLAPR